MIPKSNLSLLHHVRTIQSQCRSHSGKITGDGVHVTELHLTEGDAPNERNGKLDRMMRINKNTRKIVYVVYPPNVSIKHYNYYIIHKACTCSLIQAIYSLRDTEHGVFALLHREIDAALHMFSSQQCPYRQRGELQRNLILYLLCATQIEAEIISKSHKYNSAHTHTKTAIKNNFIVYTGLLPSFYVQHALEKM